MQQTQTTQKKREIGIIWQFDAGKAQQPDRIKLEAEIMAAGNAMYRKFGRLPYKAVINSKHLELAVDKQIGTMVVEYAFHIAPNCVHVY